MEAHTRHQTHGILKRPYVWGAGVVAVVAMVSGFAHGSTSLPESEPIAVVTEYRTVEPSLGGLEAAELASERQRLNKIKRRLKARKRKLDRLRDRLGAQDAALDGRAEGQVTADSE